MIVPSLVMTVRQVVKTCAINDNIAIQKRYGAIV